MYYTKLINLTAVPSFFQDNHWIVPSSKLYLSGNNSFQDYDIQFKNKVIAIWKYVLVNNKNHIYEIQTPTIQLYDMLKASGHVDRFTDYIVQSGECIHRADHLVSDWAKKNKQTVDVESMDAAQLTQYINQNNILPEKCEVSAKNLMFMKMTHLLKIYIYVQKLRRV